MADGTCPVCRKRTRILFLTGNLKKHDGRDKRRCPGSERPPEGRSG